MQPLALQCWMTLSPMTFQDTLEAKAAGAAREAAGAMVVAAPEVSGWAAAGWAAAAAAGWEAAAQEVAAMVAAAREAAAQAGWEAGWEAANCTHPEELAE